MARYLPGCLESLVGRDDVEVLVVDDGSKDGTAAVAESFRDRFGDRLRVVRKANGHYGSCVNAAIPLARGLYFKTLDADDSFDRAAFAAFLDRIAESARAGIEPDAWLTDYAEEDELSGPRPEVRLGLATDRAVGLGEIVSLATLPTVHSFAYRTRFLSGIGYRQTEGQPYTDNEFILYPLLKAREIRYAPLSVYRYRTGREGQSVSFESRRRNYWAYGTLLYRMLDFRRGPEGAALAGDALAYFERNRVGMARQYLETLFFLSPYGAFERELPEFVRRVETAEPGLYAAVEEDARILKSILPIRYLRVWRKLPFGRRAWVWFARASVRATSAIAARKNRVKRTDEPKGGEGKEKAT